LELMEKKDYMDEGVLATDDTHHILLSGKEEIWRTPNLQRSILSFCFFVSVVGRRFGFDSEIMEYMEASKQVSFKMNTNRSTKESRQSLIDIVFKYKKDGRSLEKAVVSGRKGSAGIWGALGLLLLGLIATLKV